MGATGFEPVPSFVSESQVDHSDLRPVGEYTGELGQMAGR
jgi:hypothetical protein